MSAEHSRLSHTCIFLAVSFQALQDNLDKPGQAAGSRCWLDARLAEMLTRELRRCRDDAAFHPAAWQSLDIALTHAALLLAQCPGGLDRERCRRQLETIVSPLRDAGAWLAGECPAGTRESRWQAATRRLGRWLRR
ncbi:hypothetical protein [Halomonas getboli]|uniref:hypothetical protein n=1 Tax=Halomonas getboli TaxID=2935862 RepID=UPI001FFF7BD5|nr:hypothetical protein [Halomonas getboli]MCK2182687.1 hypothetical protein [Halomonas getboli]